ncbi:MAG: hypothetical protein GXO35_08605 [Gammaproteobacteria bacterium]|nr:hypothetical protein [Gammaproteobacteria bacterium]
MEHFNYNTTFNYTIDVSHQGELIITEGDQTENFKDQFDMALICYSAHWPEAVSPEKKLIFYDLQQNQQLYKSLIAFGQHNKTRQ